jgi:hypothetical protein
MRLKIEMIPSTCFGKNLRTKMPGEWRQISRYVRDCANLTCVCCGKRVSSISKLDAHEVWGYVKVEENGKLKRRMVLKRIEALCKKCHRVKHIGFSYLNGKYEDAVDWYMQVNGCSLQDYRKAEKKAYQKCNKLSRHKWKLRITKEEAWEIAHKSVMVFAQRK